MNSPIAKQTPATAPRDVAALARLGRFNLRDLAGQLGLFGTDEQNMAFMGLTTDKQAEEVFNALKRFDTTNGGPPEVHPQMPQAMPQPMQPQSAPPQQVQAPQGMPAPQMQFQPPTGMAPQVAQMSQAAPQMAPQAAPAPALGGGGLGGLGGLRRTPSNNGVGHAAPVQAPQQPQVAPSAPVPAAAPPAGPSVDLSGVLAAIEKIEKNQKAANKEILDEIEHLRARLAVVTNLALLSAEGVHNAERAAVLGSAISDVGAVQDFLTQQLPGNPSGKGKKKG